MQYGMDCSNKDGREIDSEYESRDDSEVYSEGDRDACCEEDRECDNQVQKW